MAWKVPARARRSRGPAALALMVALAVLAAEADLVAAKRGCSAFGHSCFGGHGKRSDDSLGALDVSVALGEEPSGAASPAVEEDAEAAAAAAAVAGEAEVAATAARFLAGLAARRPEPQDLRLSPFLRQWLQNYRRSASLQNVDLQ